MATVTITGHSCINNASRQPLSERTYLITIHSDTKDTQRISIFWVFFLLFVLSNHRRKSNEEKFDKIGKDEVDYVENTNFYFR